MTAAWPLAVSVAAVGVVAAGRRRRALAVVDAQTQLLSARLTYPLAGVIAAALTLAAVTGAGAGPLLRAALAAVTVGGLWLAVCFLSPRTTGLGDVRLAALTSGVLGWAGSADVWQGQVLTLLLGALTALISALTSGRGLRRSVSVPMGPSHDRRLTAGAVAVAEGPAGNNVRLPTHGYTSMERPEEFNRIDRTFARNSPGHPEKVVVAMDQIVRRRHPPLRDSYTGRSIWSSAVIGVLHGSEDPRTMRLEGWNSICFR